MPRCKAVLRKRRLTVPTAADGREARRTRLSEKTGDRVHADKLDILGGILVARPKAIRVWCARISECRASSLRSGPLSVSCLWAISRTTPRRTSRGSCQTSYFPASSAPCAGSTIRPRRRHLGDERAARAA